MFCFRRFEKAFNSVELNSVPRALVEKGIVGCYEEAVKKANTGYSTDIRYNALTRFSSNAIREGYKAE